mmetsp:Transcript_2044/g.4757  ORF Transcript_2044/g.4757 Transcript_2044/m.4757 type:complete len:94 (+) Transcript_2044:66-347(+)
MFSLSGKVLAIEEALPSSWAACWAVGKQCGGTRVVRPRGLAGHRYQRRAGNAGAAATALQWLCFVSSPPLARVERKGSCSACELALTGLWVLG